MSFWYASFLLVSKINQSINQTFYNAVTDFIVSLQCTWELCKQRERSSSSSCQPHCWEGGSQFWNIPQIWSPWCPWICWSTLPPWSLRLPRCLPWCLRRCLSRWLPWLNGWRYCAINPIEAQLFFLFSLSTIPKTHLIFLKKCWNIYDWMFQCQKKAVVSIVKTKQEKIKKDNPKIKHYILLQDITLFENAKYKNSLI